MLSQAKPMDLYNQKKIKSENAQNMHMLQKAGKRNNAKKKNNAKVQKP